MKKRMNRKNTEMGNAMSHAVMVRKLEAKLEQLKKKEETYRAFLKTSGADSRNLSSQIESERLNFIAQMMKQTGYPIEDAAVILGAAIKLTPLFSSEQPEDLAVLDDYRSIFQNFAEENHLSLEDMGLSVEKNDFENGESDDVSAEDDDA